MPRRYSTGKKNRLFLIFKNKVLVFEASFWVQS